MDKWIVYEHISPSNKVYVGITKQIPQRRWKGGSGYLRKDNHQPLMANAIRKYGWDNFQHKIILEGLDKSNADYAERYLIKWYKLHHLSYNITDGGDGGLGTKHSEKTKKYLSLIHTGTKQSKETVAKREASKLKRNPYITIAIKDSKIYCFNSNVEAARKLHIKSACNITASIKGNQCFVNGYVFIHWEKTKPIDRHYLYSYYQRRVAHRYASEKKYIK